MKNIELKYISLSNNETYSYRHYSGGENVIVLVHGNLASSKFYDELIYLLDDDYTVYAIDLRGFGGSTYNRPIDTLRDFAGDLKMFVDKLELRKFDLLGWSTGGAVCMYFCSSYGYLINRLFLVASAGVSGYHSYKIEPDGSKTLLNSKKKMYNDKNKRALIKALNNKDKDYYKRLWDKGIYNINKPDEEIYNNHLEESMRQKNLIDVYYSLSKFNISDYYNGLSMGTEEMNNLNVPTMIIQGKDDLLVTVDEAKELKEAIGENAELVLLEQCGHSPMVDAPEILAKVIMEFNIYESAFS